MSTQPSSTEAANNILRTVMPKLGLSFDCPEDGLGDLGNIARLLGAGRIIKRPLQKGDHGNVDGMLVPAGDGYVIVLNENVSESRQRYSLAHEIGHLLIFKHSEIACNLETGQRFRGSSGVDADKMEERICEAVAAELLMPKQLFLNRLQEMGNTLGNIQRLATLFQTSVTSTAIRYSELLAEPCLLVRWYSDKKMGGILRPSWQLRNKVTGPRVQIMAKRGMEDVTLFDGANEAWRNPGLQSSSESLMMHYSIGKSRYTRFPMFRTESIGFGRGTNRFVLSAVYLSREQLD